MAVHTHRPLVAVVVDCMNHVAPVVAGNMNLAAPVLAGTGPFVAARKSYYGRDLGVAVVSTDLAGNLGNSGYPSKKWRRSISPATDSRLKNIPEGYNSLEGLDAQRK